MNADFAAIAKSNGYRPELMAFCCLGCLALPGFYSQGWLVVMGCCCGVAALNYAKLPFFPLTDREWSQWLSEADSISKLHGEQAMQTVAEN
jgi:hypothetical protein